MILAGGAGTRLFPLSRISKPKQFLSVDGEKSLLVNTVDRFLDYGIAPKEIMVVTDAKYRELVVNEFSDELEYGGIKILLEETVSGTMGAVAQGLGTWHDAYGIPLDEVFLVVPADAYIEDEEPFFMALDDAVKFAEDGRIVVFGVKASSADVNLGYLLAGENRLVEKPPLAEAEKMVEAGWLWNIGVTMFKGTAMVCEALEAGYPILENYKDEGIVSMEKLIHQRTKKLQVMEVPDCGWRDAGTLFAFAEVAECCGGASDTDIQIDCEDVTVLGGTKKIVCVGMRDVLVIDLPDVALIIDKTKQELLERAVSCIRAECSEYIGEKDWVEKSWGKYRVLVSRPQYMVRELIINTCKSVEFHVHEGRTEMWTVQEGYAGVALRGERRQIFEDGESVLVPQGWEHKLDNAGTVPLRVLEYQCGKDLEEKGVTVLKERRDEYAKV
jgi:mannose-1-phosphate guanylyltransferase/mannose-6-phosphate isomerase